MNFSIVVIGATGLLGRELVPELLNTHPNKRICLFIRADNEAHKQERFEALMRWIFDAEEQVWRGRVAAIRADLSKEGLAVSSEDAQHLESITDVFCLASSTSFKMSLAKARRENVVSLENLISFIKSVVNQHNFHRLHYVSTAFVANNKEATALETPVNLSRGYRNTYEHSKAEAEDRLMLSNLPYRVYRPSIIVGSSKNGRAANYATIYIALKAAYEGVLPFFPCGPEVRMDVVPSDYVASAIATISTSDTNQSIFNICAASDATTVGEIYDLYSKFSEEYFKGKSEDHFPPLRFFDESFTKNVLSGSRTFVAKKLRVGLQKLNVMLPFLSNEVPSFNNQNTLNVLPQRPPKFADYADKIFKFAIDDNFGETKTTQQAKTDEHCKNSRLNNTSCDAPLSNPLTEKLAHFSKALSDKPAVMDSNREITFSELFSETNKIHQKLKDTGMTSGTIVVLKVNNSIESVILMLAASQLGLHSILNPDNTELYQDNKLSHTPAMAKFKLSIRNKNLVVEALKITAMPFNANDNIDGIHQGEFIVATSGTTGEPKLVRHSLASIMYSAEKIAWAAGLKKEDRVLLSMPIFHAFAGIIALPSAISIGACVMFSDQDGLKAIAATKATHYVGITAHFEAMLAQQDEAKDLDLSQWVAGLCGDDYLSPYVRDTFERTYMRPLTQGYGLSEALVVSFIPGNDPRYENSVGKAIADVEVIIIDEFGQPVAPGEIGELCVRGKTLMNGYLNSDSLSTVAGGYLKTGDLGSVDSHGYIYINGRKRCAAGGYSEVLRKNGEFFSSALISNQLSGDNPDRKIQVFFDDSKAFVFTDHIESKLEKDIQRLFSKINIEYEVFDVQKWPKTPVGKVSRHGLSLLINAEKSQS